MYQKETSFNNANATKSIPLRFILFFFPSMHPFERFWKGLQYIRGRWELCNIKVKGCCGDYGGNDNNLESFLSFNIFVACCEETKSPKPWKIHHVWWYVNSFHWPTVIMKHFSGYFSSFFSTCLFFNLFYLPIVLMSVPVSHGR